MTGFRSFPEPADAAARFFEKARRPPTYVREDGALAHLEGPLPDRGVVRFRREPNGPMLQLERGAFLRKYAPRK